MILRSLELKNFRQFYGLQRLEFSTNTEKNVTLIHGENGVGKTALLNAILWCFYERTTPNFRLPKRLLNLAAKEEGASSFHVRVEFEWEGALFTVQRSLNSVSGSTFQLFRIGEDGNSEIIPNAAYFLNAVIPNDMANYFFFQGEGMGSIAESSNKQAIRDAVRDILGFSVAENALESIRNARTDLRREYQKLDRSSELGESQQKISQLEDEISRLRTDLSKAEKEEKILLEKLQSIDEILRNSNHDVIRQKQRLRDEKVKEVQRYEAALGRAKAQKVRLLRDYAISSFSEKAAKLGIEFIDEEELKGKIPAPYNVQLVEDILKQEKCICGAPVHPGSPAFGEIQKLLAKAANPLLLNRVSRARSQLTAIRRDLRKASGDFTDTLASISETETALDRTKAELQEISLEISGINFEDIAAQETQRQQLTRQIQESYKRTASIRARSEQSTSALDKLEKEVARLSSVAPQAAKFKRRLEYTKELEQYLDSELRETEEKTRGMLTAEINGFLDRFVRQDFRATLSKEYQLTLRDRADNPVGKSEGQTLLLSLTFISALINIAKIRSKARGNILTPGAIAPFVIDAPFGVLDNTYKANVATEIPKSVNQVVFLLSSGHWEGTVESSLRARVGKEYNMVLEVAGEQGKKQVDQIKIQEKAYPTTRYNADVDRTVIEELNV